jgi:hypothetical protein
MPTSQLFEFKVGCTDPPPPRRISKLSRRYPHLKKNMPVIPVDANYPAASAACRTVGERQHAPTCTSPPRVAKTKATMVMHNALAPAAPRHPRDDSASFAGASFATATSAAVGHPFPPLSVGSTSDSDDSKINGGGRRRCWAQVLWLD